MASTLPPKDRYWAVWLAFFVLGVGTLLPWNFFITANKYFEERLAGEVEARGGNSSEGPRPLTPLQRSFSNAMTLCAMLPMLVFTCLTSFLHARVSQRVRVLSGLVAILLLFVVTAALVRVASLDSRPSLFFSITMASIVLINSFGAVLQGSLFGLVGLLPVPYTTALMSGQGIAGVFAALSMISAMISGAQEERDSVFGYFVTACVVTLVAIVAYLSLSHLEFARYYLTPCRDLDGNPGLISPDERDREGLSGVGVMMVEEPSPASRSALKMSVVQVFFKIWPMAICVCLVYTVTLAVFPAVTAGVQSSSQDPTWRRFFVPVWCFLFFNILDWAGRSATAVFMISSSWLPPVLVCARSLFIPLFMLCNASPDSRSLPVLFHHDAAYIVFMILFAFSNGYLASLFVCFGTMRLSGPDSETAGTVMMFFLSLGLALGAASSFVFRALL
ncbi:equilibrative nucleoside transporter 1 isoform X1 [Petromyzon marinus]|uniref:equilibrative nucleoside transporter 1 isoform X1 n=1 Tax=Petromyzon marinus TaxID=7757 RepID=UPI003F6E94F3